MRKEVCRVEAASANMGTEISLELTMRYGYTILCKQLNNRGDTTFAELDN